MKREFTKRESNMCKWALLRAKRDVRTVEEKDLIVRLIEKFKPVADRSGNDAD